MSEIWTVVVIMNKELSGIMVCEECGRIIISLKVTSRSGEEWNVVCTVDLARPWKV